MTPFIVGIAGASGSGKSSLASELLAALNRRDPRSAVVLPLDAYYRDLGHMTFRERDQQNFDHPDALELELVGAHLQALRAGSPVRAPVYDFPTHTRTPHTQLVPVAEIVIVEGILGLTDPALVSLYDLSIFVEAPIEACLSRRLERDQRERGRSEESVRRFWVERVLPMFEEFVAPARSRADLTVDGTGALSESVDQVLQHLEATREG